MDKIPSIISDRLGIGLRAVENTLNLFAEGCTIPFISRYRKERTGGLDEVKIAAISDLNDRLSELEHRKESILKTIAEQEALTPELRNKIENCWEPNELEDLYLPYKPKRRTRAQVARENGLEPLALLIKNQREKDIEGRALKFVKGNVANVEEAIAGAKDIIAEMVSEDVHSRDIVRREFKRRAVINSKPVKRKIDDSESAKFSDYFDFSEPLQQCSSHRFLAMMRGQEAGYLRISIEPKDDDALDRLHRLHVHGIGRCAELMEEAVTDSYKRLIRPSIETEFTAMWKEKSDDEAITVFGENLRQLLLAAPLGQKKVMGIDPGFRTGCKIVCLDAQGNLLHHEAIFPHPPLSNEAKAAERIAQLIKKYSVEAIAIGNGTASRETERFVRDVISGINNPPVIYVVSENGASIYSASKIARQEFPDKDVTVRGAVSIGRRLMDPLAELVKIDPKSIGVGQYQHDVDQAKLKKRLDMTVESCVNTVGVNLNTASTHLLTYISGLGPTLANNIIEYRSANGPFSARSQLLKVPRLGPSAYRQCAGFLRIPGGKNPLDNTAVHPESYAIVKKMAEDTGCSVNELITDKTKRASIDIYRYVTDETGLPTLNDIMAELEKPGRDPRGPIKEFAFDPSVTDINSLRKGMELPGIVTNITKFGAFVDIGIHQDGMVHISELADRFISDPLQVVKLHQQVRVKVIDIDNSRKRVSLSMKGIAQ